MEQDDILDLQDLPEYGGSAIEPMMGGQTSWFSIWSDCMIARPAPQAQ